MQQQLATAQRLVLRVSPVAVGTDVHVVEEHFAVLKPREAVAQVDPTFADRLDLGPEQDDACLERLEKIEIVRRLPVLGDVRLRQLALGLLFHQLDFSRTTYNAEHAKTADTHECLCDLCELCIGRCDNRAARRTAAIMLPGSATPRPAMSNAVP